MSERVWMHDDLARDLGRWLKSGGEHWVWLNAALGEWKGPRPDVMAYRRYRYEQPCLRAFEAKISRADLLSDLRAEKWRSYLEHCRSVTFIMPSGLCNKNEIPGECGVMFRSGRGWRTERRPTDIGNLVSTVAMAKMLTCHPLVLKPDVDDRSERYRQDAWRQQAGRSFLRKIGEDHGRKVASYLGQIVAGTDPVGAARDEAAKIIAQARADAERIAAELAPVLAALGLPSDTAGYMIPHEIRKRARQLDRDGQLAAVRHALKVAAGALAEAEAVALPVPQVEAA